MISSTVLLIGLATVIGTSLFGVVLMAQRPKQAAQSANTELFDLDTHQAVMTMWFQTQLHLDDLERNGSDVTTARNTLATTVETILAGRNPAQKEAVLATGLLLEA